ncbi:MAG: hypothetical protein QW445_03410 [Candidatus Bathyarchaeia archaeon]
MEMETLETLETKTKPWNPYTAEFFGRIDVNGRLIEKKGKFELKFTKKGLIYFKMTIGTCKIIINPEELQKIARVIHYAGIRPQLTV